MEQVHKQLICPFCRGHEDETPNAIAAYDSQGRRQQQCSDDWLCRIIPNKFPSMKDPGHEVCGPYATETRNGLQELIIPTSRHVSSISELELHEMTICLDASQERMRELSNDPSARHLILFLNCRFAAGASLGHIHFQLMGTPMISQFVQERMERNIRHYEKFGRGLAQTLLSWELEQQVRVVNETENFVMFCPFASRYAFQVWIVPRRAEVRFTDSCSSFNAELAELCREYVNRLEDLIDMPAYNLIVNRSSQDQERDFWFVEIFPRTNRAAGFELGTDVWVNPVPPKTAAIRLRG